MMGTERLLAEASTVVRDLLPVALEADGRPSCAMRLRALPEIRDTGTVWRAMLAVEAVASRRPGRGLSEAVRLCGDAAVAALRGEASRFAELVRRASGLLRGSRPGPASN